MILTPLLPLGAASHNVVQTLLQRPVLVATLYLAVLSTVIAFWGQAIAQTNSARPKSAVLFSLEPVVAAFLSVYG